MKPNRPNNNKKSKGPRKGKPKVRTTGFPPDFQQKVERLDKLMKLAVTPNPSLPPGTVLAKQGSGGTLEQVGREADSAWDGVKRIMALLNVEFKSVDITTVVTPTTAGLLVTNITAAVSQGVADSQRTGDSLKAKKLRLKLSPYYGGARTSMTIALVRSKDGIPVVGDVFQNTGSTTYSGMSDQNHDQRKADVWIWHKTLVLDPYHDAVFYEIDLDLNFDTQYINASTVVSSGCLSLWAITNLGAAGSGLIAMATFDFVDN